MAWNEPESLWIAKWADKPGDTAFVRGDYAMLPDVSNPVWMQIVTGKRTVQSTKATFNLLIQNNKMS